MLSMFCTCSVQFMHQSCCQFLTFESTFDMFSMHKLSAASSLIGADSREYVNMGVQWPHPQADCFCIRLINTHPHTYTPIHPYIHTHINNYTRIALASTSIETKKTSCKFSSGLSSYCSFTLFVCCVCMCVFGRGNKREKERDRDAL